MKYFRGRGSTVSLIIPWLLVCGTHGIRVDLYLNKDKFGEFLRMEISEKGCTNVPLNWDNQALSLDTHGSCVKFYDLPYCRGKYVALQPYHGTFQDNLETIGFKHLVSSASPCGPKVPSGRYYILNGADGSVLTIDKKNYTVVAKAMPFKPYITKNQQFQIDKISLADYEIVPRVHDTLNPLTFDMSISTKQHPVRRSWRIESVYRGKYVIKNEWNNRCLYKSESGKVDEHECVAWSPNQEWMFKSIKVQPFFPSKEELNKKPLRPDETLPFQPQQDIFPQFHVPNIHHRPGQPLGPNPHQKKKKGSNNKPLFNKPFERPNPVVLNPREPFPPVQPVPIYPKGAIRLPPIGPGVKFDPNKPPVPHVIHPGRLPYPREPVVTDPKKSVWPPTLFGIFGSSPKPTSQPKKKTSDEEEEEEDEKDEKDDDEKEEDERDQGNEDADDAEAEDESSKEKDDSGDNPASKPKAQRESDSSASSNNNDNNDEEDSIEEETAADAEESQEQEQYYSKS